MEALLYLLNQVNKLTPKLQRHLRGKIKRITFKKGQIIFKVGQIADRILYIEKGLIRSYTIVNGKKASNYFMREGDIIISVESFLAQIPAFDTIEALEDCVCWGITHEELEETKHAKKKKTRQVNEEGLSHAAPPSGGVSGSIS